MFRRLDEREAGQVVAWRPPALALPGDEDHAVRAALQAAGIDGGFRARAHRPEASPSSPVTVHTNEQLASMVVPERGGEGDAPEDAGVNTAEPPDGPPCSVVKPEATSDRFDEGVEAGAHGVRASLGEEVRTAIRAFAAEHQRWRAERDQEVLSLATALAAAILRRELVADPGLLERLVRETLAPFDTDTPTPVVQLHPLDLAAIESVDGGSGIELIADASLQRGDCLIRSGASLVQAGVTDRLSALLADEAS